MISHRHACIFVHIPKTAGSSIEDLIWPGERTEQDLWMGMRGMFNKYQTGALQHLLARQIREEVGAETFARYFKFAIVRNPWDRLVSQYCWIQGIPLLRAFIGMAEGDSFPTYLELIQRTAHIHWQPQVDFLRDEAGATIVDFVGRFEAIDADAAHIFTRLGLPPLRLPRTNASVGRRPYREYYGNATRDIVARLFREDIETFGYRF